MINNKKGYTLTELLIVLGISGIIISLIASFFINNTNYYNRIDNDTELQYQAQFIMNFMTDDLMEAYNIKKIWSTKNKDFKDLFGPVSINQIVINKTSDGSETSTYILYNGDITYNDGTNSYSLAKYIDSIVVTSIPSISTLKEAKGIKLEINFKKDKQSYRTEQIIYFRNSNN